jgi:hypothetical protein
MGIGHSEDSELQPPGVPFDFFFFSRDALCCTVVHQLLFLPFSVRAESFFDGTPLRMRNVIFSVRSDRGWVRGRGKRKKKDTL